MKLKCIQKKELSPPSYFDGSVQAGFPSPAEDLSKETLDLNELIIQHRAATFFVRVEGDSMTGAHIVSGDLLVVDRALTAKKGDIVVAVVNGEFTVKRLDQRGDLAILRPENPNYSPIQITEVTDFQIWGVVTYVIHRTC